MRAVAWPELSRSRVDCTIWALAFCSALFTSSKVFSTSAEKSERLAVSLSRKAAGHSNLFPRGSL
jgi:hypothetical protein